MPSFYVVVLYIFYGAINKCILIKKARSTYLVISIEAARTKNDHQDL